MSNQSSNLGRWILIELILVVVALGVAAVVLLPTFFAPSKPTVLITSPASGITINQGQALVIQTTATDAQGITRIELLVDNVVTRPDSIDPAQKKIDHALTWQANGVGTHQLTARAYNTSGQSSDPALITVNVQSGNAPAPTPARTIVPTVAPTGAPVPCVNAAVFTGEQKVADGALLSPNQAFQQTWRMINVGTCPWDVRYQFVLTGGETLSAPNNVGVPTTLQNGVANLTVNFTAPAVPGPHVAQWRLRAPDGSFFGSLLDLRINVANPQPTPVCNGAPQIASFSASAPSVAPQTLVTLQWGGITNASAMRIDPGIGPIGANGSLNVVVDNSTTYILTAYCGTIAQSRQVTINVVQPTPTFKVTSASANVTPENYGGMCPGTFNLTGNINTTAAGLLSYRWILSGGAAPSNIMTFYAPSAGSFALPVYSTPIGTRGVIWAQLLVATPNDVKSNQVNFVNNCADPTAPPPPTRAPQPTVIPPTPQPQRRSVTGTWSGGDYSLELSEALGCGAAVCNVSGTMVESQGVTTPIIDEVGGTINVYTGDISLTILRPGAQGGFKGTVDASSGSMTGVLNGNSITLYKQ